MDIAEKMGKERQTIIYHLNNLKDKGLLTSKKIDNKITWQVDNKSQEMPG
jgi:predicted transcriptional regulator